MRPDSMECTQGCRIETAWTFHGMKALIIENEKLRLSFLLDKGAELFELIYKPQDLNVLYRNPRGYRSRTSSWIPGNDEVDYYDFYGGGWQEIFPSASGSSTYRNAFLPFHGEVAFLKWGYEVLEDTPERVRVRMYIRTMRTPFLLVKEIELTENQSRFSIKEWVTNEGKSSIQYMWGHHPAFGAPLISECTEIYLPPCTIQTHPAEYSANSLFHPSEKGVWPNLRNRHGELVDIRYLASLANGSDMLYASNLREGHFEVRNRALGITVSLKWDKDVFPYVWIWREMGGNMDYPWYGTGYVIALEPFSSLPGSGDHGLLEAISNGTAPTLTSGTTKVSTMEVEIQSLL